MKPVVPFLSLLLLCSCFHKDVMNDVADDVKRSLIYSGKEGNFLVSQEEIFQATSKKSGGGITSISGYAEYRITSYNLENGNVAARVNLGAGMEDNESVLLGTTEGKIWMYSFSDELGLHYRNPATLVVEATQKQLQEKSSLKGIVFAKPEWSRISSFYGFDVDSSRIMFTDQQGFKYYLDPVTFAVRKTDAEIKDRNWSRTETSSSGYIAYEKNVRLDGDPRKFPQYENSKNERRNSYLFGKLLLDENPLRGFAEKKPLTDSLAQRLDTMRNRLRRLEALDPRISDERIHYFQLDGKLRDAKEQWERLHRDIENENYNYKRLLGPESRQDYLLSDERNSLLIWHATSVVDTCHAVISKLRLNADSTFTQLWQITLKDFYFDPGKADHAGAFETVFSDGNPDFDYEWYACFQHKLILISQLRAACIDMKTGKLLWNHQL